MDNGFMGVPYGQALRCNLLTLAALLAARVKRISTTILNARHEVYDGK
jgi:hypothetical protein